MRNKGTPLVGFTGVRKWSSCVSIIETVVFLSTRLAAVE